MWPLLLHPSRASQPLSWSSFFAVVTLLLLLWPLYSLSFYSCGLVTIAIMFILPLSHSLPLQLSSLSSSFLLFLVICRPSCLACCHCRHYSCHIYCVVSSLFLPYKFCQLFSCHQTNMQILDCIQYLTEPVNCQSCWLH